MTDTKRVLIIEDHPDILETYKKNVSRAGFIVDTATNKEEAFERIRRRTYHVAMIDVNLTDYSGGDGNDRSGIELVKRINSLQEGTKCVVISAERNSDVPVDAHEAGIDKYIIKKRIRAPEDYVGVVRDLAHSCKIQSTGRFGDLIAYLCFPEQRWAWEHQILRQLKCSAADLPKTFADAFGPFLPALRRIDSSFSLAPVGATQLTGVFWSKAIAQPIAVSIAQKGSDPQKAEPPLKLNELLHSRKSGRTQVSVWALDGCSRSDFINAAADLG